MKNILIYLSVVAVGFSAIRPLAADIVPVDPLLYPVTRDSNANGVLASGEWSQVGFKIVTNVTLVGNVYTYAYTVSAVNETMLPSSLPVLSLRPALNQLRIELAPTMVAADITYLSLGTLSIVDNFAEISGLNYSNACTISFNSLYAPVWGDFAAVGNSSKPPPLSGNAQNTGFGTDPTASGPFTNWIPTPGLQVAVPEPSTWLILGCCLAVLAFIPKKWAHGRVR